MDRHLFDACIESLTDIVTDKVAQRLGLRPPVKAVDRGSPPAPPVEARTPALSAAPGVAATLPEYLTPQQAAELLGVSVKGLEGMRAHGRGPKYVKVGGRIRYRRSDLG
jgi:hypothetical protein